MSKDTKITVRLTAEQIDKLDLIRFIFDLNTTDAVNECIDVLYNNLIAARDAGAIMIHTERVDEVLIREAE